MKLTLLTLLTLLTHVSGWGDDHLLGGAVLGADHVVTCALVDDGGPAGGSAVGGVHTAAAGDHGGSTAGRKRGRGDDGKRRLGGRDVAGGADLGESDFKLALDVGALPEEKGEVGAVEPPVLLVLPLKMQLLGALGKVALGIERGGVSLHDERAAGGPLLLKGGCLGGEKSRQQKTDSRNDDPGFHAGILARVAVFGKVGKKRGSVTRHHRRNIKDQPTNPAE